MGRSPESSPVLTAQAPPAPEAVSPALVRITLLLAAIASGANALGTALSPWLLVNTPLLLVGLSPDLRHLLLVAGHVDPALLTLVAVVRRVISMVSTWSLAYVYGFTVVRWMERRYPRLGAMMRWIESFYGRVGPVVLVLIPGYTVSALAGAARTGWRIFLPATILGQVIWVLASVWIGESIAAWTAPILSFFEAHVVEATVIAATLVGGQQLWSRLKKRRSTEDAQGS